MEDINTLLRNANALLENKTNVKESKRKLLHLLSERKLFNYGNAQLYKIKGLAIAKLVSWHDKVTLEKAVGYLSKAITLNSKDANLWYERANLYRRMRDSLRALHDYNKAIRLNHKAGLYYIGRARVWRMLKKWTMMKKDLRKGSSVNPRDFKVYYERRLFWLRFMHDHKRADEDLLAAVKYDPDPKGWTLKSVGDYYLKKRDYDRAIESYKMALDKDATIDSWDVDMRVAIYNCLAGLNKTERHRIYPVSESLIKLLEKILDLLEYWESDSYGWPVVHFTKLSVADIFLSDDDNRMRFYHSSYMNDPEEGRILLQLFNDSSIQESFTNAESSNDGNFYLGSFLPQKHADELVMWRTYGKDESDSEARGCSIVIKREFFDGDDIADDGKTNQPNELNQTLPGFTKKTDTKDQKKKTDKAPRVRFDTTLHKVIYYDKTTKRIQGEDGTADDDLANRTRKLKKNLLLLKSGLLKLIKLKNLNIRKENKLNRAIDNVVYHLITELRFRFKSADYSYENEERVILSVPPQSPQVKIEAGPSMPKRLYVEAKKSIRKYVKKVILGPRVVHPERWSYLKVKMIKDRFKVELIKSNCKFQ